MMVEDKSLIGTVAHSGTTVVGSRVTVSVVVVLGVITGIDRTASVV